MSMELILRLFLIASGIVIFAQVLLALAGRRLVQVYSVPWSILAVCLIITGCVIKPRNMDLYIGWPFFIFLLLCSSLALCEFFRMTEHQSDLRRKFSELSMQVSLLNEENGRIRREYVSLRGKEQKDPVKSSTDRCRDESGRI